MATILDIGLLKGFSDIFVWILVFVIVYGALEVANLLKNKGLHALLAFAITAVIVITGGGSNLIVAMVPWIVVMAAFFLFLMMLGQFVGLSAKQILSNFGGEGRGVTWYILIPLIVILVIAWTQAPREQTVVNPETGETVTVELHTQRPFLGVLTSPQVLGLVLILAIAAMTIVLMTGGRGSVVGGH